MKFNRVEEEEVSLNLAPLIDVVFLLLIFFMITTTFNDKKAIDLTLPEANSQQIQAPEFAITITVSKLDEIIIESDQTRFSGIYGIEGTSTEQRKSLSQHINQIIELLKNENPGLAQTSPTIIIEADKAASHGRVIQLMDAISKLGINKIQFAVVPEES